MLIGAVQDVSPCEMGLEGGKRHGRGGRPGGGQAVVEGEEMKFVAAAVEGAGGGDRGCLEGGTRFPVLAARCDRHRRRIPIPRCGEQKLGALPADHKLLGDG